MTSFRVNDRQVLHNVHRQEDCEGPCVIHSPLPGPWDIEPGWMLLWRPCSEIDDMFGLYRGFERICPHGIGHPAPEQVQRDGGSGLHGCDGCCWRGEGHGGGDISGSP